MSYRACEPRQWLRRVDRIGGKGWWRSCTWRRWSQMCARRSEVRRLDAAQRMDRPGRWEWWGCSRSRRLVDRSERSATHSSVAVCAFSCCCGQGRGRHSLTGTVYFWILKSIGKVSRLIVRSCQVLRLTLRDSKKNLLTRQIAPLFEPLFGFL